MDLPSIIDCVRGRHCVAIEEILLMNNGERVCLRCYENLRYQIDKIKKDNQ